MNNSIQNSACFTGHRPKDLPWGYDESDAMCKAFKTELQGSIVTAIKSGITHFITGMAEGVDTYATEILIDLRDNHGEKITIEGAVPCKDQSKFWSAISRERYHSLLSKLDKTTLVSEHFTPWCMQKRNDFMLSHCSHVIAGFSGKKSGGTFSTLEKAKKLGKTIHVIEIFKNQNEHMA